MVASCPYDITLGDWDFNKSIQFKTIGACALY